MASPEAIPGTAAPKNGNGSPPAKRSIERKPVAAGQPASPPRATKPASSAPAPDTEAKLEAAAITGDDGVNPLDFEGSVETNHDLPTPETIRKIDNYTVLDRDGKSHTFRSLYTGRHTARRVLIIFIRHFYCGVSYSHSHLRPPSPLPPPGKKKPNPTKKKHTNSQPPRTANNTCAPSPNPSRPLPSSPSRTRPSSA